MRLGKNVSATNSGIVCATAKAKKKIDTTVEIKGVVLAFVWFEVSISSIKADKKCIETVLTVVLRKRDQHNSQIRRQKVSP